MEVTGKAAGKQRFRNSGSGGPRNSGSVGSDRSDGSVKSDKESIKGGDGNCNVAAAADNDVFLGCYIFVGKLLAP